MFDAAGNRLVENDNPADGSSLFSRIDYQLAADGTYYVGVSGAGNWYYGPGLGGSGTSGSTGNYRLDLSLFTPVADAAGDTLATALNTGVGPTSGPFTATTPIGDGLYLGKDVDIYKFTAQAGQGLAAVTSAPNTGGAATPSSGCSTRPAHSRPSTSPPAAPSTG